MNTIIDSTTIDSLLTAGRALSHDIDVLKETVSVSTPTAAVATQGIQTFWAQVLTVLSIALAALTTLASLAAARAMRDANRIASRREYLLRGERQDIIHWLTIRKGTTAVRSAATLGDAEIREMPAAELHEQHIEPSFVLNKHWDFHNKKLSDVWAALHPVFEDAAKAMHDRISKLRGWEVAVTGPQGGDSNFEAAYEELVKIVEDELGASNPWALGDTEWRAVRSRMRTRVADEDDDERELCLSGGREGLVSDDNVNEDEAAGSDPSGDEYARHIIDARHQAFRDFDKLLIALASGALALSLTFLTDALPSPRVGTQVWLLASWAVLTLSLTAVLLSLAASTKALTKTLTDHYAGELDQKNPGGLWQSLTRYLNYAGTLLLVLGIALLLLFAAKNLKTGGQNDRQGKQEAHSEVPTEGAIPPGNAGQAPIH